MGQRLGREPLGVDVGRFQQLLQQPLLIVGVQDGEAGLQPDQFRMATQDLCGHRVEGAQPAQPLGRRADQVADPFAHLARSLVGEGDDQQLPRLGPAGRQNVRQTGGQDARLARAGSGQHQNRPLGRLHRLALFGVEPGQIVGRRALRSTLRTLGAGEVGNAGSGQVGHRGGYSGQRLGVWGGRGAHAESGRGEHKQHSGQSQSPSARE